MDREGATMNVSNVDGSASIVAAPGTGSLPDLGAGPTLVTLVRRHLAWLVLTMLLLAGLLRVWQVRAQVEQEEQGAVALAAVMLRLGAAAALDDAALIERVAAAPPWRHVDLRLIDARGGWRAGPALADARAPALQAELPRPAGPAWRLQVLPAPGDELDEALDELWQLLVMLGGGGVLAWWWLHARARRALRPLSELLLALQRMRCGELRAAAHLPPMPSIELQAIAAAVDRFGLALEAAETGRRHLQARLHSLQEDERVHLARELHDELGQLITACRIDASAAQRRLSQAGPGPVEPRVAAAVATEVSNLGERLAEMQQAVRQLLRRMAPQAAGDDLPALLAGLAQAWSAPGRGLAVQIEIAPGALADLPGLPGASPLPAAIYRMTQEALTNAARHAGARRIVVGLARSRPGLLKWRVEDDGCGIDDAAAAMLRGCGLAGLRERVWALGGELSIGAARPGAERPGLCLSACLPALRPGDATVEAAMLQEAR
jgi:two-component system sensor histidine kinase UhpB